PAETTRLDCARSNRPDVHVAAPWNRDWSAPPLPRRGRTDANRPHLGRVVAERRLSGAPTHRRSPPSSPMKVTILCHELSSNAVMRAHRLAQAARTFAEVKLIGSVSRKGAWPALPQEPWIRPVRKRRFPRFYETFLALV